MQARDETPDVGFWIMALVCFAFGDAVWVPILGAFAISASRRSRSTRANSG